MPKQLAKRLYEMRKKRAILAVLVMLVWAIPAKAVTIALDWYSETGFTSGELSGQPVHFVVTLDGSTGKAQGFSQQSSFLNMETLASLTVGTTQVFSTGLTSSVNLAEDEGMDVVSSTIAGVFTKFSSPYNEGPVRTGLPIQVTPSSIDQYLLIGLFFPRAFEIYFDQSFISYGGNSAELTSLRISEVPLPAGLPLLAGGLGLLVWTKQRRKASKPQL